jgi:hypothetical protein
MIRGIWILLAFLTFAVAAAQPGHAFSPAGEGYAALADFGLPDLSRVQDQGEGKGQGRGHERRIQQFDQGNLAERKERKGLGGFWGGPYWGYGPRWGHRCESCRADCDGDQNGPGCKRCRIRCGW